VTAAAIVVAALAGCGHRAAPPAAAPAPAPAPLANRTVTVLDPRATRPLRAHDAMPTIDASLLAHGEHVAGGSPPWVTAVAEAASLDLGALARALGVDGPDPDPAHELLVGPLRRSTRHWTYVSGRFRIQQLLLVWVGTSEDGDDGDDADDRRWPVALVSSYPGADTAASRWRLVLLDPSLRPIDSVELPAPLPPIRGLWDTLATDLDIVGGDGVSGGDLGVWIDYGHSGGGEPCDVTYSFRVRIVGRPSRLVLRHHAVERDPCPVAGYR